MAPGRVYTYTAPGTDAMAGRLVEIRDGEQHLALQHDGDGRIVGIWDAGTSTPIAQYAYYISGDSAGMLSSISDPRDPANVTEYHYSGANLAYTRSRGRETRYAYQGNYVSSVFSADAVERNPGSPQPDEVLAYGTTGLSARRIVSRFRGRTNPDGSFAEGIQTVYGYFGPGNGEFQPAAGDTPQTKATWMRRESVVTWAGNTPSTAVTRGDTYVNAWGLPLDTRLPGGRTVPAPVRTDEGLALEVTAEDGLTKTTTDGVYLVGKNAPKFLQGVLLVIRTIERRY